jgi:ABC-2 type transport system ATP-binding protein
VIGPARPPSSSEDPSPGAAVPTLPTASPAPAVSTRRLEKKFGEVTALDHVTLDIPPGLVLGLLGPNGAGKTTLIRILLGLTRPTSGEASVLGQPVGLRSARARVGYMPQDLAVYTDLTVEENLALFGRLNGLGGARLRTRSREVLELVRLTERRRSLVSELSGGMRRRVSFASALLPDPDLLLLDEPTVGVDPELRAEFWNHFHRLTENGKTIVLTTHYLEEANRAHRVVFLHAGAILATGSPEEVKARTRTVTLEDAFLYLVRAQSKGEG